MFRIFKRKQKGAPQLTVIERQFINIIVEALSLKYPIFKKELKLEVFAWISPNRVSGEGSFVFGINNEAWQTLSDTSMKNFLIKNFLFKNSNKQKVVVDLYTAEGLLIDFGTTKPIENNNMETIDVSEIWEKHFLDNDLSEVESILGALTKEQLRKFNLFTKIFRIELNGTCYFPIHDIGDGNYLAINRDGSVFKITHDPFKSQKIYNTIFELIDKNL